MTSQTTNPPYFAHTAVRVPPPQTPEHHFYDRRIATSWLLANQVQAQTLLKPYPVSPWQRIMMPYPDSKFNPYVFQNDILNKINTDDIKSDISEHISVEASDDSRDKPDVDDQKEQKKKNPYSIEELLKKPDKIVNNTPLLYQEYLRQPSGSMIESQDKIHSNRSSPASYCSNLSNSNDDYEESIPSDLKGH